jgi:hypothetical protein
MQVVLFTLEKLKILENVLATILATRFSTKFDTFQQALQRATGGKLKKAGLTN